MRTVCRLLRSGARPPRCAQVLSPSSTGALPERIGPLRESNRGIRTWWPPRNRHIGTVNPSKCPDLGFRCFRGTDVTIPWRPPRTNTPVGLAERTYPLGESTCAARGEDLCASGRASAGSEETADCAHAGDGL